MKIALIFPNNNATSPYLDYYLKILNDHNVTYTVYKWDREGKTENDCVTYSSKNNSRQIWYMLVESFKYRKFIKARVNNEKYDKVIVFSCQIAILLSDFLIKQFKNEYLVDVRDYSKIIPFFKSRFKKVLNSAEVVCSSSHGFKTWLPKNLEYIMSHNVSTKLLKEKVSSRFFFKNTIINVDTIGALRDHISNSKVIDSLKNDINFNMKFIGEGYALPILREKAKTEKISNIYFHGYYRKEEEFDLLKNTDFINIMVGNDFLSQGLTSNRLYLCALLQIPAIVNSKTEQSNIIDKFGFGIVIDNYLELAEKLIGFKSEFNQEKFVLSCNEFLNEVKKDQSIFESVIKGFTQNY